MLLLRKSLGKLTLYVFGQYISLNCWQDIYFASLILGVFSIEEFKYPNIL